MVRSGGSHHRKRSRSRSLTPDHKRNKSSRDYDKERLRRRSRSRDRIRRSRSRDRKKDKKISESRVRSKPLKLKRRSRSRSKSRSKSKDKNAKKEEKKETKVEDEPFDPTNLDKIPGDDEEWVVTDVIEEPSVEDNGHLEEEMDYEADEDDQYSHRSSPSHHSPNRSNDQAEVSANTENNKQGEQSHSEQDSDEEETDKQNKNTETHRNSSRQNDDGTNAETPDVENENITSTVSNLKQISSIHREKINMISSTHEMEKLKSRNNYGRSKHEYSENLLRLSKDHIRQAIELDEEFHKLRVKHELARHKAEMAVIHAQLRYWKDKH